MNNLLTVLLFLLLTIELWAFDVSEFTPDKIELPTNTFKKVLVYDHIPYLISDEGLFYLKDSKFLGWTTKNSELPSDFLTDFQIMDNQFYITSLKGFCTFNGILTFLNQDKDNSGLPDNFLQALAVDEHNVYFASRNKLISFQDSQWHTFKPEHDIDLIKQICLFGDSVFILTIQNQIFQMKKDQIVLFTPPWLANLEVNFLLSADDKLYFCTNHGLITDTGTETLQDVSDFNVRTACAAPGGDIWAGGQGFLMYRKDGKWEDLSIKYPNLKSEEVISLACDFYESTKQLKVYAVIKSNGLLCFNLFSTESLNLIADLKKSAVENFEKKEYNAAEKVAKQVLLYQEHDPEMLELLGKIYLSRSDYESFLGSAFPLASDYPEKSEFLMQIASIYEEHGQPVQALQYYRMLLYKDGDKSVLYEKIGSIYEQLRFSDDAILIYKKWAQEYEQITPYLRIASLHEKAGDFRSAEADYLSAISNFPNLENVYLALARSYLSYRLSTLEEVQKLLEKVTSINPNNSECYNLRGYSFLLSSQFTEAESELLKSLRLDPNNGEAHLNLAELYFVMKKNDEMEKELQEGTRLLPNHPRGFYLKALVAIDRGDYAPAIENLEEVVRQDPYNDMGHYYLAKSYQNANYFKSALLEYKNVLEISPDFRYGSQVRDAILLLERK
ncbi:MAG: tetratricopeptide repeat protein [Candidatus Wallbacteria bacterium]|nr:tetratricopeptide repeat protein [Candidatus Wallbacteria bacterium]